MLSLVFVSNRLPVQRISAILASIALASMVNTFCHLHTPLVISALRVGYGVGFGLIVAVVIKRIVAKTGLLNHEETASA